MSSIYQVEYTLRIQYTSNYGDVRYAFIKLDDMIFQNDVVEMNNSILTETINQLLKCINQGYVTIDKSAIKILRYTHIKTI